VDVPVDMDVSIDVNVSIDDHVAVVPAMPAGRAAPADSAIPRKAAPIPAWAAPARSVPTVVAAAPNELRLLDRRAFDERRRRRERANADRRLRWKSEQADQSRRRGER
jgi:hypothetical protein